MKKIIIIMLSFVLLLTACTKTKSYAFGSIDLGMSTVEVEKILGEPDYEMSSPNSDGVDVCLLGYENQTFFGIDNAYVSIYIDDAGVMSAYAQYQNEYVDKGSYIIEYNTIKDNLVSVLGNPQNLQEDEESFYYRCEWSNNFITMEETDDGDVKLRAYIIRSDHMSEVTS
jgi:hypothetical protein